MKMIIGIFSVWIATCFYHVTPSESTGELTIDELCTEYKDAFDIYDQNKDGFIDATDVKSFIDLAMNHPRLLRMKPSARKEVERGLLTVIQKLNGRMTLSQFAQFMHTGRTSTDITLQDVYHIQGDQPMTIKKLAELWSYSVKSAEELRFAMDKNSVNDVVTAQEFVDFLNRKNQQGA